MFCFGDVEINSDDGEEGSSSSLVPIQVTISGNTVSFCGDVERLEGAGKSHPC
jgi:hypothetical protein